jgi:tetratricopeptide (TPR) repeat protein
MTADDAERSLALAEEASSRSERDAVVSHLSAAIRAFTATGDKHRAAMACARLGDVFANHLGNLTAGRAWFARARRLLEAEPACIEQGWIAVAAMGCEVPDPVELLAASELALDRARRFGDVNLETKALADGGLALVQAGRLSEGMAMLDEAMALACGPANDLTTAAKSACSFFTACYYAADFERVGTWAGLLRQRGLMGERGETVVLSGHCDSVEATLLLELGRWTDAERLLARAKALTDQEVGSSWHPAIALADLRVKQGRHADAEELLLGKDQALQALLPAARLHLSRGEIALARAAARRGLRAVREDRLRGVELFTLLVEIELAHGDLEAATLACAELRERVRGLDVPSLRARADAATARVQAASGDFPAATATLEGALERLDVARLPWLHATLLLELARVRERVGERPAAVQAAKAAAKSLERLDVVIAPDERALLERLALERPTSRRVVLAQADGWWSVSLDGTTVRLKDTKGLRYVAELVLRPGVEQHALDLVDRVEGVSLDGIDRRALGDAGPALDGQARAAYRQRIEALRAEADEWLELGDLEAAERAQQELDQLVAQLANAFGLGGRDRVATAAERARLNVTRAIRSAISKLGEALPAAGEALGRQVRTGLYCVYAAGQEEIRFVVQC